MSFVVECPNCKCFVEILQTNCCIFRHGAYKNNMMQIPPHSAKSVCDNLIEKDAIYGCGKPFRLVKDQDGNYLAEICEYI